MCDNANKSLDEIYTCYYKKSYLYVKSYVHDDMVAEDITTESIIALWKRMKQAPVDSVAPFLFSILKNKSLDYLKHISVKKNVHDFMEKALVREMEIRMSSLESSDPAEIFSSEIQQIIEKTLQSLPEKTRDIFILSRFNEKSYKEIAEYYNITVKGVEYHVYQAVSELRTALSDYLPLLGVMSFFN